MLTRIEIENILKHKKLNLDIEKATAIIGENDKGKSSLIKALGWSMGQYFANVQRINTDTSKVKLHIDNQTLIKAKTATGITYVLNNEKFVKVGVNVPRPVEAFLNVSSLNFQFQFDPPIISSAQLFTFLEDEVELAEKVKENLKNKASIVQDKINQLQDAIGFVKANSILIKQAEELTLKSLVYLKILLRDNVIILYTLLKRLIRMYYSVLSIIRELSITYLSLIKVKVSYIYQNLNTLVFHYQKLYNITTMRKVISLLKQYKTINNLLYLYQNKYQILNQLKLLRALQSFTADIKLKNLYVLKMKILNILEVRLLTYYKTLYYYTLGKGLIVENRCPVCGNLLF
ncbi:MAG: ATP-binding protein [Sulfolobaceae archaeon]